MYMDNEGMTLATEILHELKRSARRWFIAFLVMLGIEVATVCGFLWYLSLPVDESVTTQTISADDNVGTIDQHVGDNEYESDPDSNTQAQSRPQ